MFNSLILSICDVVFLIISLVPNFSSVVSDSRKTASPAQKARLACANLAGCRVPAGTATGSIIHAAHSAMPTWAGSGFFILRYLRHQAFGRQQQARNGGCVLQCRAGDLFRI